jgi:pimeloyl-ACP methyl ester carboxylesterase
MMPRALAHSNAELLALRAELEALADYIGRIQAPVTILHGLRHTLVPTANTAYVAERLKGVEWKRVVLVAQAGHFLHLHLLARGHVEDALSDLLASPSVAHPVCA